jgi:DNA-binding transcriptional MerR regulator
VLRYWEQEFTQLKPLKRRGNRRYYQHHEVLLIRRIRELLYEHGFTINGARNRLEEPAPVVSAARGNNNNSGDGQKTMTVPQPLSPSNIRKELKSILKMLER